MLSYSKFWMATIYGPEAGTPCIIIIWKGKEKTSQPSALAFVTINIIPEGWMQYRYGRGNVLKDIWNLTNIHLARKDTSNCADNRYHIRIWYGYVQIRGNTCPIRDLKYLIIYFFLNSQVCEVDTLGHFFSSKWKSNHWKAQPTTHFI